MPQIPGQNSGPQPSSGSKTSTNNSRYKVVGNHLLSEFSNEEILKDIAQRISDGRRLIIPMGLPQSGKSMFIASLIAYAFRRDRKEDNSCNFAIPVERNVSGVDVVLDALDNNRVLPSTRPDEITITDIDMESRFRRKKIRISLLDFSGEDVERLTGKRVDDSQHSAEKIKQILAACIAQRAIFAILTPVDEQIIEVGQESDFDRIENTEMLSLINILKTTNRRLYNNTKFLMIITKYDKLPSRVSPVKYLQLHRNGLYNEYSGYKRSYGLIPYSVGDVVGNTIIKMVLRSPRNFWYTLYRWCTGKHVLPWWKRLFA